MDRVSKNTCCENADGDGTVLNFAAVSSKVLMIQAFFLWGADEKALNAEGKSAADIGDEVRA